MPLLQESRTSTWIRQLSATFSSEHLDSNPVDRKARGDSWRLPFGEAECEISDAFRNDWSNSRAFWQATGFGTPCENVLSEIALQPHTTFSTAPASQAGSTSNFVFLVDNTCYIQYITLCEVQWTG